jgi:hypothetical protein
MAALLEGEIGCGVLERQEAVGLTTDLVGRPPTEVRAVRLRVGEEEGFGTLVGKRIRLTPPLHLWDEASRVSEGNPLLAWGSTALESIPALFRSREEVAEGRLEEVAVTTSDEGGRFLVGRRWVPHYWPWWWLRWHDEPSSWYEPWDGVWPPFSAWAAFDGRLSVTWGPSRNRSAG